MQLSRSVLCSVLVLGLTLTACGHAPEARQDQADIAGIGPRPKVFGRHAWDAAQKRAADRAEAPAAATPATPPAPAALPSPPVAIAAAPPPSAPVIAPVAPTPPAPATAPVAAPQIAAAPPPTAQAAAPPAPAPAAPAQQPQKVKPPKPAQLADAPAKKGPGLWQRLTAPPAAIAPIVGGYGPATDRDAVATAAAFAVHESPGYVLKAIYSAKVQVVAGTNYSLCLWVRRPTLEPNPLHRRMVAATVFQGLDGHRELTAWKEVGSCHAGAQPE
ncbi:MAG: hypothetical protein JF571_01365 [Asticcacaulis sp.]|nr:hypothetical protein [Asticcacaulis sp.]